MQRKTRVRTIAPFILINITIVATINGQQAEHINTSDQNYKLGEHYFLLEGIPKEADSLYKYIQLNFKDTEFSNKVASLREWQLESIGIHGYSKLYSRYLIAVANQKNNDYQRALNIAESIEKQKSLIRNNEFYLNTISLKINSYRELGRFEQALFTSEYLLSLIPSDNLVLRSKVYYNLANIYEFMWDFDAYLVAIDSSLHYAELAKDMPRIQRALRGLVNYYYDIGEIEKANKYFIRHGQPLELATEAELSYKRLNARTLEEEKRYNLAIESYKKTLESAMILDFKLMQKEILKDISRVQYIQKKERNNLILRYALVFTIVFLAIMHNLVFNRRRNKDLQTHEGRRLKFKI